MQSNPVYWLCYILTTFLCLPIVPTRAQDVADLSLFRSAFYEQLSESPPQPIPETFEESPFVLLSVMGMSENFLSDPDNLIFVRAVTMDPPTGSLRAMDFFEEFGGFVYFDTFATAAALESAFRAGVYQFTFSSVIVGDEVYDLSLPDASFLAPAQISNFAAAQAVDATQPFTLHWDPFSPEMGGVRVEIYDAADGAQVFDSGPLLGGYNSMEIPANTLQPDRIYSAEVALTRLDVINNDVIPSQSAGSVVSTRFPLKTSSGATPTVSITSITINSAGEAVFIIECAPGLPLNLQQAGTLNSSWETVRTFTPDASPTEVTLSAAQFGDLAFFQATQ